MKTSTTFLAAAGMLALGISAANISYAADETEKCYGVAAAGKNDCASANGTHSCAGHAATDKDANEWIAVPAGLCERLAGGSTKAPGA